MKHKQGTSSFLTKRDNKRNNKAVSTGTRRGLKASFSKNHNFLPHTSVKSKENRTFGLSSKVLSLDNKNKKLFYFVLCSLNRTFANENRVKAMSKEQTNIIGTFYYFVLSRIRDLEKL